jgi:hypothetical protein
LTGKTNTRPGGTRWQAGLFASALDVDHFLAAHSLSLGAATTLAQRPVLHSSLVAAALVAATAVMARPPYARLLAIVRSAMAAHCLLCLLSNDTDAFLVGRQALASHHWRDAARRGLWLWPLPLATPLVPSWAYLAGEWLLPFAVAVLPLGSASREGWSSDNT